MNIYENKFFDWIKYSELYMHMHAYMRSAARLVRVVSGY